MSFGWDEDRLQKKTTRRKFKPRKPVALVIDCTGGDIIIVERFDGYHLVVVAWMTKSGDSVTGAFARAYDWSTHRFPQGPESIVHLAGALPVRGVQLVPWSMKR